MTFLVCYTNGSCKNNNLQRNNYDDKQTFTSGAGVFIPQSFRFKHRVENQSIPIRQKTLCKNNAANLIAIRECLKTAYSVVTWKMNNLAWFLELKFAKYTLIAISLFIFFCTKSSEIHRFPTLSYLLDVNRVHVFTSSRYAINGLTEYCSRWIENGWLNRNGDPLVNQELWMEIVDLRDKIPNVEFFFTDHDQSSKNYGMQEAKRLAKQASKLWGFPAKRQYYPSGSPNNSRNTSTENSPARSH